MLSHESGLNFHNEIKYDAVHNINEINFMFIIIIRQLIFYSSFRGHLNLKGALDIINMSNAQILREFDLNTFNTKQTSVKSKLPQLVEELKRIFSLSNLEKDPSLVYSMDPDLWVPLELVAHLEPIVSISKDKRLVRSALKEANLEYDPEFERVRSRVEIPRTTLIIRDVETQEELLLIISEFNYRDISHESHN